MRHTRLAVLELNEMRDFVVYCFCVPFNIPLPVSTRKKNIARRVIKQFQSWAKFSWRKRLYAEVGLERERARIKQGTNRARFSSIAEWDVRLFIHSLCQTTEAQNLNAFLITLWKARKPCEAKSKATVCPALFDETLCRRLKWKIFFSG